MLRCLVHLKKNKEMEFFRTFYFESIDFKCLVYDSSLIN